MISIQKQLQRATTKFESRPFDEESSSVISHIMFFFLTFPYLPNMFCTLLVAGWLNLLITHPVLYSMTCKVDTPIQLVMSSNLFEHAGYCKQSECSLTCTIHDNLHALPGHLAHNRGLLSLRITMQRHTVLLTHFSTCNLREWESAIRMHYFFLCLHKAGADPYSNLLMYSEKYCRLKHITC